MPLAAKARVLVVDAQSGVRDTLAVTLGGWAPSRRGADLEKTAGAEELVHIMGPSPALRAIFQEVKCVAPTKFAVVLHGETGTGKEVLAKTIHELSRRRKGPFVPVDCGAIPPTLIETELFGHERGAFTGADARHRGQFEAASGGTLFLDEVGNLPLPMQSKLLRVLQEYRIRRVGGGEEIEVDIRVLAASNVKLEDLVARKSFRRDLYYRLNEFTITIPPLRERPEDILYLCDRFTAEANAELGKNVLGLDNAAAERAITYAWPGNVRELRNVIRRAVLLAHEFIRPEHLSISGGPADSCALLEEDGTDRELAGSLALKRHVKALVAGLEKKLIKRALELTRGNKMKAARLLEVDYKTLLNKLREYGLARGVHPCLPPQNSRGCVTTCRAAP